MAFKNNRRIGWAGGCERASEWVRDVSCIAWYSLVLSYACSEQRKHTKTNRKKWKWIFMNPLPPLLDWWFQSCARCFLFPHIFAAAALLVILFHALNQQHEASDSLLVVCSCSRSCAQVCICFRWHSEKRWLFPFIMDWIFTRELRKSVLIRSVSLVPCLKRQSLCTRPPNFSPKHLAAALLTAYVHVACSVAMRGKTRFSFLPVVTIVKCTIGSRMPMRMLCYK